MADAEKKTAEEAPTGASSTGTTQRAVIKNVDMSEDMQQASVDIANEALQKFEVEKDIAAYVKKQMDQKFGPTWHSVVGKNYGSYVTHGMLLPFPSTDLGLALIEALVALPSCRDEAFYLLL